MVETGRQLKRGAGGSVGRVRTVRRSGADAIEVEAGEGAGDRKRGGENVPERKTEDSAMFFRFIRTNPSILKRTAQLCHDVNGY